MADIEPPSFSLGIDLDFEPPSFSLGIDLDIKPPPPQQRQNTKSNQIEQNDDDFKWRVSDSDPDSPEDVGPTRLRRLRRGGPRISSPPSPPPRPLFSTPSFGDDDIEDFSSEDNDKLPSTRHGSLCSSSKFPLSGSGVLKRQQESTVDIKKRKQDSSCAPSTSLGSNKGKSVFPDFTASPLRSFQLLESESDSDDLSEGVHISRDASGIVFSKTNNQKGFSYGGSKIASEGKTGLAASTSEKQDLWKTFNLDKSCSVHTPVFDELVEELVRGGKPSKPAPGHPTFCSTGQATAVNNDKNSMQTCNFEPGGLPCHRYFFHDDLRVQTLVQTRLPYFCPLSVSGNGGSQPRNASAIDYMSQFGNGNGATQQTGRQIDVDKRSKRAGKRNRNTNTESESLAWVNPKQTASTPQNAGKRRVRADSHSAGRWFTSENGAKVYVSKSGQELTGRPAYIQSKKDNGGFRKSKKKRAPKKK